MASMPVITLTRWCQDASVMAMAVATVTTQVRPVISVMRNGILSSTNRNSENCTTTENR